MLQQGLQVILNGEVELGFKTGTKESIRMKSLLLKTEQQTESVRNSPEFLRCTQEEHLGRPFADVCESIRHQAASVDEVSNKMIFFAFQWFVTYSSNLPLLSSKNKNILYFLIH